MSGGPGLGPEEAGYGVCFFALPALCGEGGAHGNGSRGCEPAGRLGGHWEVVSWERMAWVVERAALTPPQRLLCDSLCQHGGYVSGEGCACGGIAQEETGSRMLLAVAVGLQSSLDCSPRSAIVRYPALPRFRRQPIRSMGVGNPGNPAQSHTKLATPTRSFPFPFGKNINSTVWNHMKARLGCTPARRYVWPSYCPLRFRDESCP